MTNFNRNEIYQGPLPPTPNFALPSFLEIFTSSLIKRADVQIDQVVLFGGVFTDAALGRLPKDYDIYIASPRLINAVTETGKVQFTDLIRYFPGIPSENAVRPNIKNTKLGECVGLTTFTYDPDGDLPLLDIAIGSIAIEPAAISQVSSSPILSGVLELHPGKQFAYHNDFAADAATRIMRTPFLDNSVLQEKAQRKGLELRPM